VGKNRTEKSSKSVKTIFSYQHYKWVQFIPALVALGLWVGYPNWVLGQGVINQSSTNSDDLDSLFNLPTNTVTVIAGVTIDTSVTGGIAVFGSSRAWGLTNAATLTGKDMGAYLGAGGTVNNQPGGSITGGYGLAVYNGDLTVNNAGSITGESIGIAVNHSGTLNNLPGGTITAQGDGIYGFGGPQTIVNAGTIIGTNNTAVLYGAGGSVNNLAGGFMEGYTGVFLNGGFCYVTNAGLILGDYAGVTLFSGGNVNNLTNGNIAGGQYGVWINFGGSVDNAGTIFGTNANGVLSDGGSVNNQRSGTISGGTSGVDFQAGLGYVTNAGSINGGNAGVDLVGGSVNNSTTDAIITGGQYGISIFNGGSVDNAGFIICFNYDGVLLSHGGSLNNQSGGIIVGGIFGVEIRAGAAVLTNAGTIFGQAGTAIQLSESDSSTVTLQARSDVRGDIVGGNGNDVAYLQGNGIYSDNFLNFETLTVQADATGWFLAGANIFSTATEVQSGLLCINGVLTTPLLTVDNGGTLGGGGTIDGSVLIKPASTIAPGMTNIATLTVSGDVMLQGTAMMKITSINADGDQLIASNSITYGSTLMVTNLSAVSPTNGASYQLFSATNYSGAFRTFNLPALSAGLAWNWNPTNGTLSVISAPLSLQVLSPQLSGTNFSFCFTTTAGQGYTIWGKTNLATSSWTVVTNLTGDSLTDQVNVSIQPNSPAGFFRVSQP